MDVTASGEVAQLAPTASLGASCPCLIIQLNHLFLLSSLLPHHPTLQQSITGTYIQLPTMIVDPVQAFATASVPLATSSVAPVPTVVPSLPTYEKATETGNRTLW